MSGYPPGYEFLEAQFAEIARQVIEQARDERIQASPWAYGDKINLGAAGAYVGQLPTTSGGLPADSIVADYDGSIVIDADGNVVTE